MLTQVELKVLELAYKFSCKSVTIPFCWENGSISLKKNRNILQNYFIWFLLLPGSVLKTCILFQKNDINELIINGIFVLGILANITNQLTVGLYKTELVQLVNGILYMNLSWGKFMNCNIYIQLYTNKSLLSRIRNNETESSFELFRLDICTSTHKVRPHLKLNHSHGESKNCY